MCVVCFGFFWGVCLFLCVVDFAFILFHFHPSLVLVFCFVFCLFVVAFCLFVCFVVVVVVAVVAVCLFICSFS